ncbi:uncharacterized protein BJX67DRAFT_379066 [Aspergillus lucknowensis]|uniref:Uncharacterized protein n=1 Tax=Aspergillus lucknowensis TaxID=176173 RepID=A0ABR4LYB2_9EURO
MPPLTRRIHRIHHHLPLSAKPRSLHPHSVSSRAPNTRQHSFSTGALSLNKASAPNGDPKNTHSHKGNPELPRVSLDGLGISKNVRVVLYTLLGIWGTFETYFYYQAIMRWWRARNQPETEAAD